MKEIVGNCTYKEAREANKGSKLYLDGLGVMLGVHARLDVHQGGIGTQRFKSVSQWRRRRVKRSGLITYALRREKCTKDRKSISLAPAVYCEKMRVAICTKAREPHMGSRLSLTGACILL